MCRMCLVEVEGPRGATLQPACFVQVDRRHGGRHRPTTGSRRPRTACSSSCWPTTRSTARCATRAASARSRTRRWPTGRARAASSRRSATSRSRSPSRTWCCSTASAASSAPAAPVSPRRWRARRRSTSPAGASAVEVATFPTEPFSSYFSGNTVQICPVGALTATPYRFTARPWDLDQVESTCTTCSVGCRVAVQSSQNRLTRLLGIDSEPVNHGWLCDKGRFAFESVNGDEVDAGPLPDEVADEAVDVAPATASQVVSLGRQPRPVPRRGRARPAASSTAAWSSRAMRKEGELVPVSWGEALAAAAAGHQRGQGQSGGPGAVAVIGGARLTNESAYAWAKLAKGVIGTDSVDAQLGDGLPAELVLGLPRATIDEACAGPAARHAGRRPARGAAGPLPAPARARSTAGATALVEIAPDPDRAQRTGRRPPCAIRPGDAPASGPGPHRRRRGRRGALGTHHEGAALAVRRARARRARLLAEHPGRRRASWSWPAAPPTPSRARWRPRRCGPWPTALPKATFLPALRRGNVFGALDMGLAPGSCPGGSASSRAASASPRPGARCPATPGLDAADDPRLHGRRAATGRRRRPCAPSCCSGADPLSDFPDHAWPSRRCRPATSSWR